MGVSKITRRSHMYLGLFLSPWMLMYALSSVYLNHARPGDPPVWEVRSQGVYHTCKSCAQNPQAIADGLLEELGITGRRWVQSREKGAIVIGREAPLFPKRITYEKASGNYTVEERRFHAGAFLAGLHTRRGFETEFVADDAWALIVDLVIGACLFWVASGLWMWWQLKTTRLLGTAFAMGGMGLFVFFLLTI